jgi:hypothetical protein
VDGWLFISGQGPLDLLTGEVIHGTIEEETLLTLSHIRKIIETAGEMNYTIKGVHARVSVIWNFQAPEGAGDTHYSIMRGSKIIPLPYY